MSRQATQQRLQLLDSVSDYSIRKALLEESFASSEPQELLVFLASLEKGLIQQHAGVRSIVHSLFVYWLDTYTQWLEWIAEMPSTLLVTQMRLMSQYNEEAAWKQFDLKAYVFPDDRMLTLGERRAHARRPTPETIERFLFDPDQVVTKHILQNSRTTLAHVIRMACKRPTAPMALQTIFKSQKFGLSRPVMLALIQNPYTPYQVVIALSCLLYQTELDELSSVESLSPMLKKLLPLRRGVS